MFDVNLATAYDLIYKLPVESGIIYDEVIKVAYKREWYSKINIAFNKLYTYCRDQRKASFFCCPRFSMLDNDLKPRVLFWLHIPKTGYCVVLRREENLFATDPWNIKENYKLLNEGLHGTPVHLVDISEYLKVLSRSRNWVGWFRFNDLDGPTKRAYKFMKKSFEKPPQPEKESSQSIRMKQVMVVAASALREQGLTQTQIAKRLNVTVQRINDIFLELNLRPIDKKVGKTPDLPQVFDEPSGVDLK